MHLYKASEWENGGRWYVNDLTELGTNASSWRAPAQLLNLSKEEFIFLLKNEFHAASIYYGENNDVLIFSFETQKEARAYKNFINRKARLSHFRCGKEI